MAEAHSPPRRAELAVKDRYPDMPALLAEIRERPMLFFTHRTTSHVRALLDGLRFAEDRYAVSDAARLDGFDRVGFEAWVDGRHNSGRLSLSSFELATLAAGSEAEGFDRWFAWYDEYTSGEPPPQPAG